MSKFKFLNFRYLPFMLLFAVVGIMLISLLSFVISIAVGVVFIIVMAVFLIVKKLRVHFVKVFVMFVVFVTFTIIGGVSVHYATEYKVTLNNATVSGTILSDSDLDGKLSYDGKSKYYNLILTDGEYYIDGDSGKLDSKISVSVNLPIDTKLDYGNRVVIKCDIIPTTIKLDESFSVYNYLEGVRYNLDNPKVIDIFDGNLSLSERIKINSKNSLLKIVPNSGIMYSLVFGDKNTMSSEFVSSVNLTGLAHLFAVSGLHLGLVASIIGKITRKFKAHKLVDYLVVIILSGLYALLVGFGPSVARAFLMLTIYKTGKLFGLRYCGISSLSLSALIILLINPLMLFSLSFELSVMSIVGICFFYKPLLRILRTKFKSFNSFVAMNLSVNIATMPILLHYFGSTSLIFLFANLLIVPVVVFVFPIVFIFTLLSAMFAPFAYVLYPLGYLFSFIEMLAVAIAKIPFLSVNICMSVYWIIAYIAFLVLISSYSLISKKPKVILAVILCVFIVGSAFLTSFGRIDGSMKAETVSTNKYYDMVMLDIGNEHILVCNGNLNVYILGKCVTYMREKNIRKIDGLVKSSFSSEEIEALYYYRERLNVNKLITNKISSALTDCFPDNVFVSHAVGEFVIVPTNDYVIQVTNYKMEMLFVDNRSGNINSINKTDILYCVGKNDFVEDSLTDYYVNDNAVINNIPQSVNSYFTFIIKNAKIKVT